MPNQAEWLLFQTRALDGCCRNGTIWRGEHQGYSRTILRKLAREKIKTEFSVVAAPGEDQSSFNADPGMGREVEQRYLDQTATARY